jgi:hypothetical protein
MPFFESDLARVDAGVYANDCGKPVTYRARNGQETVDELAIVDFGRGGGDLKNATFGENQQGQKLDRKCYVAFRRSVVSDPEVNASFIVDDKTWAITAILDQTEARIRVLGEAEDVSKRGMQNPSRR